MAVSNAMRKISEEEAKADMTPMIDVVFNLLIFFMCTLNFKTLEGMLAAYLPKDLGVFSRVSQKKPEEPIYIQIIKDNTGDVFLWIGGERIKGEQKFDKLYSKVKKMLSMTPNVPVIIDPDIEVAFQDVISTLNACRRIEKDTGSKIEVKFSAKALK